MTHVPLFYFAIGKRPAKRDLELAIRCGQRAFLVVAGSRGARDVRAWARERWDIRFCYDNNAFPPNDPGRISLADYTQTLIDDYCFGGETPADRPPDGHRCPLHPWAWTPHPRYDWAPSYDRIGDPDASAQHYATLVRALIEATGDPAPPIVPVLAHGGLARTAFYDRPTPLAHVDPISVEALLARLAAQPRGGRAGPHQPIPDYAIGGMVIERYSTRSVRWYERVVGDLERAVEQTGQWLRLHLFGVGRPALTLRSELISSFDSSGPAVMAKHGWQKIAGAYTDAYGLSPSKLRRSREARLVWHLCRYRDRIGAPWRAVDAAELRDDADDAVAAPASEEEERAQWLPGRRRVSLPGAPRRLRPPAATASPSWSLPPPLVFDGAIVWTSVSVPHLVAAPALLDQLARDLADLDDLACRWLVEEVLPDVIACLRDEVADDGRADQAAAILRALAARAGACGDRANNAARSEDCCSEATKLITCCCVTPAIGVVPS